MNVDESPETSQDVDRLSPSLDDVDLPSLYLGGSALLLGGFTLFRVVKRYPETDGPWGECGPSLEGIAAIMTGAGSMLTGAAALISVTREKRRAARNQIRINDRKLSAASDEAASW
jgi:hypothetical protein